MSNVKTATIQITTPHHLKDDNEGHTDSPGSAGTDVGDWCRCVITFAQLHLQSYT